MCIRDRSRFWPESGRSTGNGVIWEYTGYEPSGFVTIRYYPNMPFGEIPSFMLGLLEKYPDDPHLASSVAAKLAGEFHDREMSLQIYLSFLSRWDGSIPQLMEYASGGRCRYDFKGEGGDFYTIWRMASILFEQYEKDGTLGKAADIAPNVSAICSAIYDSLDTCGGLPENSARLKEDALLLMMQAESLIGTDSGE